MELEGFFFFTFGAAAGILLLYSYQKVVVPRPNPLERERPLKRELKRREGIHT
jgi:hypothetical protein